MNQMQKWEPGEDQPPGGGDSETGDGFEESEDARRSAEVRLWATDRLRKFAEDLQPYVDGTLGSVSPRHATVYLQTLKEISRLWGAAWSPPKITDTQLRQIEARVRDEVAAELEQRQRAAQEAEVEEKRQRALAARREVLGRLQQMRETG